jgi:excisionase family DNA binding protein
MGESTRITVKEIADRLRVSEMAVYDMLKQGVIPAIRPGRRRWIVTRYVYEQWERTCGLPRNHAA